MNRILAAVGSEDGAAAFLIGQWDVDFAIEAARAHDGFVEVFGTVGGSDDDDAFGGVEAVHGGQEGVVGLLEFAVLVVFAVFAEAIDFVDKDDGRTGATGLGKEFADAFGPDADVDLGKVAAAGRKEIGVGFASDGFGKKGFAGAGRANQKNTFRKAPA